MSYAGTSKQTNKQRVLLYIYKYIYILIGQEIYDYDKWSEDDKTFKTYRSV